MTTYRSEHTHACCSIRGHLFDAMGYLVTIALVSLFIFTAGFKAGAKECRADPEWCANIERSK